MKYLVRLLVQDKREGFNVDTELYTDDKQLGRATILDAADKYINSGLELEAQAFEYNQDRQVYVLIKSSKFNNKVVA